MSPELENEWLTLYVGDCRDVLKKFADESIDSTVTDPPYELGFMGKKWDSSGIAFNSEVWNEVFRVLKPGGHLLAFGGTRTWHRVACAIEDVGFEIRDSIAWMYGSGFPKSLNVAKAIDKKFGLEREVVSSVTTNIGMRGGNFGNNHARGMIEVTVSNCDLAKAWDGWGTALKPAFEPIVVARKPLVGNVADNVLCYGTGALNIDGCRIAASDSFGGGAKATSGFVNGYEHDGWQAGSDKGRWPANVILDESQAAELDKQSGQAGGGFGVRGTGGQTYANGKGFTNTLAETGQTVGYGDTGGASRFFYTAKANKSERPKVDGMAHPTVKPLSLIKYLIRLVTPDGGIVLDPFVGSGTTIEAAFMENRKVVGIELTNEYLPLIQSRIDRCNQKGLF